MSTGKCYNPGKYREKVVSVPLLKNCPDEFRKRAELVSVPDKGRIRASNEKLSGRVSEKGRIGGRIEKW